jgi:5-methylcytosine-specific restriction endonuclease McrA
MLNHNHSGLSDAELLIETRRRAGDERLATAALVSLLAEVDARRLYLSEGYSSMFAFCTRALRLSEPAAYARITAARACRRIPMIMTLLEAGTMSLTTVTLLAPHLDEDNHERILDAARDLSKRDVEKLIAALDPQPDVPSSVRALPTKPLTATRIAEPHLMSGITDAAAPSSFQLSQVAARPTADSRRTVVAPIAPKRYLLRLTVNDKTHSVLERLRALLRHQVPDGDVTEIVDRALTLLLEQVERTRLAAVTRTTPKRSEAAKSGSRRIPAAVRREVWARDGARCTFVSGDTRCDETGFLELHHRVPFAAGGPSTVQNLQLRCRAHNAYEAARDFPDWRLSLRRSSPVGRPPIAGL